MVICVICTGKNPSSLLDRNLSSNYLKYKQVTSLILFRYAWNLARKLFMFYLLFSWGASSHPIRKKLYEIFTSRFSHFTTLDIFLICDTNARLGSLLSEKNTTSKFVINPSSLLFLEFLEFSRVPALNKIFFWRTNIRKCQQKKVYNNRDMCLSNALKYVVNFEIEPTSLIFNGQTCHRHNIIRNFNFHYAH